MKTQQLFLLFLISFTSIFAQEQIQFPSEDGLQITGDYYKTDAKKFIILFHQAGYSRGAYREIAPKLNTMGYSCLAIDQRSGKSVNDVPNLTFKAAQEKGLSTKYIDAYQDIKATIAYVKKNYQPEELIIWGSSYSSSLVLKHGGEFPDQVDGILAFSPGEYYEDKQYIQSTASDIQVPTFITSAANEQKAWQEIYDAIPEAYRNFFIPEVDGIHGSRALWGQFPFSGDYWKAVTDFLKNKVKKKED